VNDKPTTDELDDIVEWCPEYRGSGKFGSIACPTCEGRGYKMRIPGKPSKRRMDKASAVAATPHRLCPSCTGSRSLLMAARFQTFDKLPLFGARKISPLP
jgi:hypothetical protein